MPYAPSVPLREELWERALLQKRTMGCSDVSMLTTAAMAAS